MGKKQYEVGKKFEEELCWWLSNNGYYVIYNEKGVAGSQPCDAIAIKNNIATLIECKHLENKLGIFDFDRLETNQLKAYDFFKEKHNTNMVIAILWNNNVYFINFGLLQFFDKSIDLKNIEPNIKNFNNKENSEITFDLDENICKELKAILHDDELKKIHEKFEKGTETVDDLLNNIRYYVLRTYDNQELELVEKKYYDKIVDLYKKGINN